MKSPFSPTAPRPKKWRLNELYGLGYDNGRRYLRALGAVTEEDIRRVAQTYFDEHAETLVVVGK